MKGRLILFLILCYIAGYFQDAVSKRSNGNPIIPDMIADPSIVKINGVYYCYATTDGYNRGLATSGPPVVWQSKDFVNWSFKGIFFPSAAGRLYWAPSKVIKVNGKFYLYPTLNHDIYAAKANSPEGPFHVANGADTFAGTSAPKPMVTSKGPKGTKGIDAEVFIDADGKAYMYWAQRGAARFGNIDILYTDGYERIKKYVFNNGRLTTPICKPLPGDSAGVYGAALLWQRSVAQAVHIIN